VEPEDAVAVGIHLGNALGHEPDAEVLVVHLGTVGVDDGEGLVENTSLEVVHVKRGSHVAVTIGDETVSLPELPQRSMSL